MLEDAWRAATGSRKLFLQALVQVAVSMHHHSQGNRNGARSVLARAVRNISGYEQGFGGLDLDHLRKQLAAWTVAIEAGSSASPVHIRWMRGNDPATRKNH